jgi:Arc/MetJ-type ribon-helix-helix transcriptional regulator
MAGELSPHTEAFIRDAVAHGVFPSREALLETAVERLRSSPAEVPLVETEHMAGVEEAIADLDAGRGIELTDDEWDAIEAEGIAAARRDRLQGPE